MFWVGDLGVLGPSISSFGIQYPPNNLSLSIDVINDTRETVSDQGVTKPTTVNRLYELRTHYFGGSLSQDWVSTGDHHPVVRGTSRSSSIKTHDLGELRG